MALISLYGRVIGLDVHQAQITACALIEGEDGVHIERCTFKTFKRGLRELTDWCRKHRAEVVVMESTGIYWKSPYAALEKAGLACLVVNAHHVKNVPGRKTDVCDAEWLATLARAGLLKPSFVPPERLRRLRLVSRQRQKLAGMLAAEKNRLGKVLADAGVRLGVVVSDINGKSARAMIAALIAGATPEEALQHADRRLKTPREEIGTNIALFAGADRLASWAGLCPGNNKSAGKRKRERLGKGNTYVRRLLCEFVQAARKTQSVFQTKHKAVAIRRGFKRAIMACAHKMLRIIWAMLLRNEPYRDATVDYEALSVRRNAPRWIKALVRFGYLPASAATR